MKRLALLLLFALHPIVVSAQTAVVVRGKASTVNASNTPLGISGVFTGAFEDTRDYTTLTITVFADKSSTAGGLEVQWSSDATNVDLTDTYTVTLNVGQSITHLTKGRYYRLQYTNGGTAQTVFRLASTLRQTGTVGIVTASGPLTDTQLRATPVPISGTVTATPTGTQAVSGTVTTTPPSNASTNVAQINGTTVSMNTGTRDAGTQRVTIATNDAVPVTGTFWQATQPVSGTVTTTPPANASTNLAQIVGTAADVNSGVKSAGTLRVVLATDQPALTNKLLVTPDSVALPANQSVNLNQVVGTAVDVNSGTKSAGTVRVVLATDQPALTNKLLVTPDSVALPANQSVNVAQIGGTNTVTGGVAGIIAVGGNVANAVAATSNPVPVGGIFTTTPATLTTGQTATMQFTAAQNLKHDLSTVAGAATAVGNGTAAGALRVSVASDSTGTIIASQATAANLNVRDDTSGATAAAVPARADYIGLNDGTNTVGNKAHSAANDSTAIVTGMQMAAPVATWCVNHIPAAATKATISQGAGAAGVRHVAATYSVCFAAAATAGPAVTWTIRDGATGAGTVIWGGVMSAPVNGGNCTTGTLNKVGTAATAMTIEFAAAGAATTIETVALCGYDVQ